MFKSKITPADLTQEDIAALLRSDQRRRNNRKVGTIAYLGLWLYGRRLVKKQKNSRPIRISGRY